MVGQAKSVRWMNLAHDSGWSTRTPLRGHEIADVTEPANPSPLQSKKYSSAAKVVLAIFVMSLLAAVVPASRRLGSSRCCTGFMERRDCNSALGWEEKQDKNFATFGGRKSLEISIIGLWVLSR